jgi:formamidopyrimidine-DNA glycosylase
MMFELPETVTLVKQINQTLLGKSIHQGSQGNSPHKFVWYNHSHEEFAALTREKTVGEAWVRGRWVFVPFEPGYVFLLGECGGKVLYHPAGENTPARYHILMGFKDGSHFSVTTQMWGAMELYERGQETERPYVKDMRTTPIEAGFTFDYFNNLVDSLLVGEKRSVKALLTQDQLIPGLGNAIAQDILFNARLHPRHPLSELDADQRLALYTATRDTLRAAIDQGGRYDEVDLFNHPGGYVRLMDKQALGRPCPVCGGAVQKIAYLGGSCYVCTDCQK